MSGQTGAEHPVPSTRSSLLWFALVCALCATCLAWTPRARADVAQAACVDGRVTVVGALRDPWPLAVDTVCRELLAQADSDPGAQVALTQVDEHLSVEVRLPDGRVAVREVSSPAALRLTLRALVSMPPTPSPAPAPPAAASAALSAPAPRFAPNVPRSELPPSSQATPLAPHGGGTQNLYVELGLSAGPRLARAPTYLFFGASAYAGLRVQGWLLGLTARWDAVELLQRRGAPRLEMDGVGAGFVLARRIFANEFFALEGGATALIIGESESVVKNGKEEGHSASEVRYGGLVRALAGKGPWRFLATLDAELSPSRLRHTIRLDPGLPPLPAWSTGFSLGACWGEHR